jgi:hypothetical protein
MNFAVPAEGRAGNGRKHGQASMTKEGAFAGQSMRRRKRHRSDGSGVFWVLENRDFVSKMKSPPRKIKQHDYTYRRVTLKTLEQPRHSVTSRSSIHSF